VQEKVEDTKGVIRSRYTKVDKQCNGQIKKQRKGDKINVLASYCHNEFVIYYISSKLNIREYIKLYLEPDLVV
jgi:hypothetical protein